MTSQSQKIPTITEWDAKYKLPKDLGDLLGTYDGQFSGVKPQVRTEKKFESGAETNDTIEIESLTQKENFDASYYLLKDAIRFEEWIQKALNGVIENAKDYEANINQIDEIKNSVIEKINTFYEESSVMLEQQKVLVDTGVHVQSILSYFTDCEKLEKDVDNLALNISNIHIYEPNLQRFLSEIMDALEFFQSKPNYKNSQAFLEKYDKVKKKLLSVIKSMFIKIFTRSHNDIVKEMDKFSYDKLEITNKNVIVNHDKNRDLLVILYPEFNQLFSASHVDQNQGIEGKYINKNLRNLLSYLHLLNRFDFDCVETLMDLFGSYYGTFRKALQNKVLENTANQLHKIPQKDLQTVTAKLVSFVLQASFFELIYHNHFFNNTIHFSESNVVGNIVKELLSKYYEYIFGFIQIEHELKNFFEAIDVLNFYISPIECNLRSKEVSTEISETESPQSSTASIDLDEKREREKNFIEGIFQNLNDSGSLHFMVNIQKKLKDENGTNFEKFIENFVGFLKNIRSDINSKLYDKIQYYVNNHINNFNMNQYWKEFNQKYNSNPVDLKKSEMYKSPYFRADMKNEIFPLIKTACELLFNLKNRADKKSFQSIYNQIISITVNNTYLASDLFVEKIDSFLFLLKNFMYLVDRLNEFSISLNLDDDVGLNRNEGGLLDKIVTNVSIFGGKKISPKMLEFDCDLKMEPIQHLNKISDYFIQDIDFIISIKLIEYLDRYRSLEAYIPTEEGGYSRNAVDQTKASNSKTSLDKIPSLNDVSGGAEKETSSNSLPSKKTLEGRRRVEAEAVKKEMESMLSKDMINKCYLMFTHNAEYILQDLSNKMQNYLSQADYEKVYRLVEIIINNLMDMLSQFYILILKNYSEIEYSEFGFMETNKLREKFCSIFKNTH